MPAALSAQLLVEPVKNPEVVKYFYKGARTKSMQGMELWNGYMFSFLDGGHCKVYNFVSRDSVPIAEFSLESAQKDNHSNQVSFGLETAKGGSFPLLYVTIGKPGSDIDWKCMVESITKKGKKWSSKLEQVITLDTIGFDAAGFHHIFGAPSWMIDRERGDLWVFSALKRTKFQTTGEMWNNKYLALKFRIPKLSEGKEVTLTAADLIEEQVFDFDAYATQSGSVHDGKIYYTFGFGKKRAESPSKIRVYDLDRHIIAARYDLREEIPEETEAVILPGDGYMYVNTNSPHVYRIPVPDYTVPEATNTFDAIRNFPALAGATYYVDPLNQIDDQNVPAGYEPFYMSTYSRHGMRYLDDPKMVDMLCDVLDWADAQGVLTAHGKSVRERFQLIRPDMDQRAGELTQGGMRQWREAARRLVAQYPTVFAGNPQLKSESTNVMRTAMSMASFNQELKAINPDFNINMDVSSQFHYWLNPYTGGVRGRLPIDEVLRSRDGEWYQKWRDYCNKIVDVDRVMAELFTDVEAAKAKVDPIELEYALFLLANDGAILDHPMLFMDIFTPDEVLSWWELENYKMYMIRGKDPVNLGRGWQRGAYILENILNEATTFMQQPRNGIHMRFGHDACLMGMLAMMDADTWGKQANSPEEVKDIWQLHKIPMATICSFNFYRSKSNDDVVVKVLLNGKAMKLPVAEVQDRCYRWSDLKNYYLPKIEEAKAALDAYGTNQNQENN
jgi:hypothetical protein